MVPFGPKSFDMETDATYAGNIDATHVGYSPQPSHDLPGLDSGFGLDDGHTDLSSPVRLQTPTGQTPAAQNLDIRSKSPAQSASSIHSRSPSNSRSSTQSKSPAHPRSPTSPEIAVVRDPDSGSKSPAPLKATHPKASSKPIRHVSRNSDGKYPCTEPSCTDDIRTFNRKCEWSKHMDKHDRPYKCDAEGCEKMPGFTYNGGLLRHQREVHGKYGGPKNPLKCPHRDCKRSIGKVFSRKENLEEHMRRCHTSSPVLSTAAADDRETSPAIPNGTPMRGKKRKADDDLRDVIKRLDQRLNEVSEENAQLKKEMHEHKTQAHARERHIMHLMADLELLRNRAQEFDRAGTARHGGPTTVDSVFDAGSNLAPDSF